MDDQMPTSKDLPMSANVSEISVKHFVLDLVCKMEQQVFDGSIIFFCCSSRCSAENPTEHFDHVKSDHVIKSVKKSFCVKSDQCTVPLEKEGRPFKMVLDCHKLDIQKVEGIFLSENYRTLLEIQSELFVKQLLNGTLNIEMMEYHRETIKYLQEEHCVRVFMDEEQSIEKFPNAVQIWYNTRPDGPSLKWTKDQDGKSCVFTIGHFLSNRSLFPSQDFPTALPTWQANVMVKSDLKVLATGDWEPVVTTDDGGNIKYCYHTNFPMPSCTFAIAVGSWKMHVLPQAECSEHREGVKEVPVRLFAPECLKEASTSLLTWYLPLCFVEVQGMLGVYPFHRLDVLVVPACFDSLGMANPSLLFLSQSILCPDGSMCVRVAHELCHTWFGVVIGPLDWTEEWMTEGFCTYLEDLVHARVCQMEATTEDYLGLRKELNLRVLQAELENTDQDLQSLRPNKGQASERPCSGEGETRFLKNGMNPEKKFMQVHYLKGYFLLRALEDAVGRDRFLSFLKDYAQKFIYQLVTSQDFLKMFFEECQLQLRNDSLVLDKVYTEWLDNPGMPHALQTPPDTSTCTDNSLKKQVMQQVSVLKAVCRKCRQRKRGQNPGLSELPRLQTMSPTQIILLLDNLLDEERLPSRVLDHLKETHGAHFLNAEVCHRWCELVIKHKHRKSYQDVKEFLIQHQAMGIYLYGEAMIAKCPTMVKMVRTCFQQLQCDMPDAVLETVSDMLFPT